MAHTVAVEICLDCTSDGRVKFELENSKSILFGFDSNRDHENIVLGAAIHQVRSSQSKDRCKAATITFWADEASDYASPGALFTLHYSGRIVGTGKVLELP